MSRMPTTVLRTLVLAAAVAAPAAAQEHAHTPAAAAAASAVAMRRVHDGDAPVANGAARAPRQDVVTETVTYATIDGKPVKGFLAKPRNARTGTPAIVVVHEWWGVNDNIRMMTERLAGEGYVALAVDLFGGNVATTPDSAMKLYRGAMERVAAGEANVAAAVEYLRAQGAAKVGTVGWCFGGHWSLRTGLAGGDRVQATVMYYGQPITEAAELARLRSPLLGLFGTQDQGIPEARVREMEAALAAAGKPATIRFYDAGHGFANPSGRAYNAAAAEAAWKETLAFFGKELR